MMYNKQRLDIDARMIIIGLGYLAGLLVLLAWTASLII